MSRSLHRHGRQDAAASPGTGAPMTPAPAPDSREPVKVAETRRWYADERDEPAGAPIGPTNRGTVPDRDPVRDDFKRVDSFIRDAKAIDPLIPVEPSRPVLRTVSAEDWLARRCRQEMARGSVIVHAPSGAFQAPGGGENQLIQTALQLEARGIAVRPFVPWTDRLDRARLVHLFGMSPEGLELARLARSSKVPLVISPICWLERSAFAMPGVAWRRRLRDLAAWAVRTATRLPFGWRSELLSLADAILPNSSAEARQIVRVFGADPTRVTVVPNGVDPRFLGPDPSPFRSFQGDEDFVLYVGRIEPRKNVLGLIRALRRTRLPLVVIGDVVPGQDAYGEACRRAGRGFVRWLPRLEHADPMLASAYAAARVFALPSYYETPGLAALEAALAGCAVVITPNGSTREYFGDRVHYARPGRPGETARAVAAAWERGADPSLARHIERNYLWSEVARRTAEVYDQVAP